MASSGRGKDSLSRLLEQIPASVPDAELDDYIANLILQQSKRRGEQYERKGIGAYLDDQPGPSNRSKAASTNKDFLASVIRNVEGHNSALLKQQIADTRRAVRDQRTRQTSDTRSRSPRPKSSETEREHRRKTKSADDDGYSSKMDKYFRKDYDPARDIGVEELTDGATGLIAAEPSSAAWDRMMTVLAPESSEDAEKGAKRQRKEERDRIRALRSARRESRDSRHERHRSRSPSPRRHAKERRHRRTSKDHSPPASPAPKVREWDLGKNLSF